MKKSVISALIALLCVIGITACSKDNKQEKDISSDKSKTNISSEVKSEAQSSIEQNPEQDKPQESKQNNNSAEINELSVSEARSLVAETIDTDNYMVLDGNTNTQINSKKYYVFIVAKKSDNTPVGQVAVDCKTGEKYNYKGEDILEDYSNFKLFDPETDIQADFEGIFTDGQRTLELLPMDNKSFEYILDDDGGIASITGATAKDNEKNITFTYNEDGSITISGDVTGTFNRQ